MRFLVTGSAGQVGFEVARALSVIGEVVAVDRKGCDLTDESEIRRVVSDVRPEVIINAAAYTLVDQAESEVETAFVVNGRAPEILGEEAEKIGALVVHFSTDYVFDGEQTSPYTEEDAPNPRSVYGKSKLQGEQALRGACQNVVILRTSWVFGAHGDNFTKKILKLASEREHLDVVADQWGAPTSAVLLADSAAHMMRNYEAAKCRDNVFPVGVYHVAAAGETNWCEYARFVVAEARRIGVPLKARPDSVRPIATSDFRTTARRPANSRFSTRKFTSMFGLRLPPWQEGVRHVLGQLL